MKRLLLLSHLDPLFYDNSRLHHLIAYFRTRFDEVTVLYLQRVSHSQLADQLVSFASLTMEKSQQGNVKYIGVHPWFATGKVQRAHVGNGAAAAPGDSFTVERFKEALHELVGGVGYLFEASYGHSLQAAWRQADGTDYDVAIGEGLWAIECALRLRDQGHVRRVVADDFDFSPGNYMNSSLRRTLIRSRENNLLRQCDAVVSVGEMLKELRESETGRPVALIPNGIDASVFAGAREKVPHPPTLAYVGSVEEWSALDVAIRALPLLPADLGPVRFLIVGHGKEHYLAQILALAQELGLAERVQFLGKKAQAELPAILAETDIGLATFLPIPLRKYAASLKVVEYLAAGVCPLVTEGIQAARGVTDHDCGLTTKCEASAIAAAITTLFRDPAQRLRYVENGRALVESLAWDKLLAQYQTVLDDPLSQASHARPTG